MTLDEITNQTTQKYKLLKSKNNKSELDLRLYSMMKHELGNLVNPVTIIPSALHDLFYYDSNLDSKDYEILLKKSENINKLLTNLMRSFDACSKPERIKDNYENPIFSEDVINYFKCVNGTLNDETSQDPINFENEKPIIHSIISSSAVHINDVFKKVEDELDEIKDFIDENYEVLLDSFEDKDSKTSFKKKYSQITQHIPKSIHIAKYAGETMLSLFDESLSHTSEFDLKDLIDFSLSAYEIQDNVNFNFTNEFNNSVIKSHEGILYHVLSNALKNAYEAQSDLLDKSINNYVTINITENYDDSENPSILINIENTGIPPLKTFEEPGSHRGLGTYVISQAIKKLGGTYKYVIDDINKTTTLKIELPYNSK